MVFLKNNQNLPEIKFRMDEATTSHLQPYQPFFLPIIEFLIS